MTTEQQTWLAIGVVVVTAGIFIWRLATRKKSGCGGGCSCPVPKKPGLPR